MLVCAELGWPWKAVWWQEPDVASTRGASGLLLQEQRRTRRETHPSSGLPQSWKAEHCVN